MMLVSGAGYKALVTDIIEVCKQDYDLNIQASYGNFGQILAQINRSGMIQAVISSDNFFTDHHVKVSETYPVGDGTLVLAWRKGLHLSGPQDISKPEIRRFAIPHTRKALYGRAGWQFLQHTHLIQAVENKLYVVSTVPQVTAYLVAGEVDAGFVNLTDIQKVQHRIGGYIKIKSGYKPIHIVSGVLKGQSERERESLILFRQCISSTTVKKIAHRHGL